MVPRLVATSATIIPCGGNTPSKPLSIPVNSNQTSDEGMSLIVQLGTTTVGYTPTLTTAVVSSGSNNRSINFRSQLAHTVQPTTGVAKHRLPMQINRQPQVNRALPQQHAALPVRNIAALARPITQPLASTATVKSAPVQCAPSPTIAGRVLASPVKDSTLDDDMLEGVVEKRPKYHKHLPLNYQYVLQDHNYGAPPPPTPASPPKPLVNGVSTTNGLTRSQPPVSQPPSYASNTFGANRALKSVQPPPTPTTFNNTTISNVFGIGTRVQAAVPPAEESDVDSSDNERETDPQGEETETANEGEDNEDDSVTRCICDFQHDDGYMICCDKCSVWQHVDCMGIDRANIPDEYQCERCQPRRIDKQKAIALQMRKKKELLDTSDSSNDSSSSSDINVPVRKLNISVNNRRRNEPAHRKNNTNNSKQRRDLVKEPLSTSRNYRQTFKKKQVEKKPTVRRKSTQPPLSSPPLLAEKSSPVDKKPTVTGVEQLRQWIDSYEEAVTNHYSPELRARIASIKVNGIHSDLKLPSNLSTTPKVRVSLLPSGVKILLASVSMSNNQPLVELRGKYMLCGSGPSNRPPRPAVPPPGPYIFHYKLPRDNTEVCVDARTYGNDARFVRRSCKPNAEICNVKARNSERVTCREDRMRAKYVGSTGCKSAGQQLLYCCICHNTSGHGRSHHFIDLPFVNIEGGFIYMVQMRHCIEKGALHLYLVTTRAIEKNGEITIGLTPGLGCSLCGEKCTAVSTPTSPLDVISHKSLNGLISPNSSNNNNNNNTQISDKRRRGRRRTVSENLIPPKPAKPTPKPPPKSQSTNKVSPIPKPTPKVVPSVRVPTPPPRVPTPPPPEPVVVRTPTPPPPPPPPPPPKPPSPPPPAPTTRSATSNAARKPQLSIPKKDFPPENVTSTRQQKKEAADKKNKMTREERKMEAIMKAFERMEKDQARKQEAQARQTQRKDSSETDVKIVPVESKEKEKDKEKSSDKDESPINSRSSPRKRKFSASSKRKGRIRSQSTPQPVLRPRRTLRRSQPIRERSLDSGESSDESPVHSPAPPPPTAPAASQDPASAGLLVEFAKSYESPPHGQMNTSSSSGETPPTPMSQTALLVAAAVGPLAPGFKFPKTKKGLISSWFKSPESSPSAQSEDVTLRGQGFGCKKRWLRQAISEECDSPNSRPDLSNSPTEHAAPLKKRRLARESISEDHSFTPPSTPTHIAEGLSQMTDDEDTVSSPQDNVKPTQECPDDGCGSSQESEGPDSPAAPPLKGYPGIAKSVQEENIKHQLEEETEESEEDDIQVNKNNELKEDSHSDIKGEIFEDKEVTLKENEDKETETYKNEESAVAETESNEENHLTSAAASAIKRKLSISEYRQRKQQVSGSVGGDTPGNLDRPSSPTTSATSSLSSSSSDEEDEAPAVIAKSFMLETTVDTGLVKKPTVTSTHLFDSAPTLVERQRENLTQRLKREFGLFLSDDEEQEKARKQANADSLNKEKDKESSKREKKSLPPPPPPSEPPYQQLFFPGVGHPMYTNRYPVGTQPTPVVEQPFYNPSPSYYNQLPH